MENVFDFVTELLSIALRRVSRDFLVSFVALRLCVSVISLSAFSVSAPFAPPGFIPTMTNGK